MGYVIVKCAYIRNSYYCYYLVHKGPQPVLRGWNGCHYHSLHTKNVTCNLRKLHFFYVCCFDRRHLFDWHQWMFLQSLWDPQYLWRRRKWLHLPLRSGLNWYPLREPYWLLRAVHVPAWWNMHDCRARLPVCLCGRLHWWVEMERDEWELK